MESVVRCTGITKTYHSGDVDTKALRGVDLEIRAGELFMLVGPSGCGKTTLISIIAGILEYDQGRCEVLGHELHSLTERERSLHRGLNLGFVFQAFNLIPTLTITENVAIPLLLQRKNRNEAMERAQHLLKEVGLAEKCQRSPRDLSGGQQQRVAIARALVHDPKIIVCDEPTSSLDQDTGHHILELFREVALSRGRTVIIVTHDTRIFGFADRIGRMNDGLVEEVKSVR